MEANYFSVKENPPVDAHFFTVTEIWKTLRAGFFLYHSQINGRVTAATPIRMDMLPPSFILNKYSPVGPDAEPDFHCFVNFQITSGLNKADMPVMIKKMPQIIFAMIEYLLLWF